jgi:hypothetical protein
MARSRTMSGPTSIATNRGDMEGASRPGEVGLENHDNFYSQNSGRPRILKSGINCRDSDFDLSPGPRRRPPSPRSRVSLAVTRCPRRHHAQAHTQNSPQAGEWGDLGFETTPVVNFYSARMETGKVAIIDTLRGLAGGGGWGSSGLETCFPGPMVRRPRLRRKRGKPRNSASGLTTWVG